MEKQFKYDLTIGMIVKNEIKYLRRCLETLQPLREAISCELIITDTGSTDGTQEVAKEFADVYLEFEWCDDFAKARNTGTEIAQGRWFFCVDADNHFDESLLEIATFLKKPQVDILYDHAMITIRNYTDTEDNTTEFFDTQAAWLLNFSQGRRLYRAPIHESIFLDAEKGIQIPSIMHHWGYLKETNSRKKERNIPLMRRLLKQSPKDLRARYQLLVELPDTQEKEVFLLESVKVGRSLASKSQGSPVWVMLLRIRGMEYFLKTEQWDKAKKWMEEWTDYIPESVFSLEFLGWCLIYDRAKGVEGYERYKENFSLYRDLFEKQQQNPQVQYYALHNFPFQTLERYAFLESELFQMALRQGDQIWAKDQLTQAIGHTYFSPEGKYTYTMSYCNFAFLLENYTFLGELFDFVEEKGKQKILLESAIENKVETFSQEEKQRFLDEFSTKSEFLEKMKAKITPTIPNIPKIKETLVALLMEKRMEEAKTLYLLLEQASPEDQSLVALRPLFSPPTLP